MAAIRVALLTVLIVLAGRAFLKGQSSDLDPRINKLLMAISEERLEQMLRKLQSFETRNTMASPDSPARGIGAARQWILDEMKKSPRLQVSFDTYQIPKQGQRVLRDVELRNVMAVLPGRSPRRIYISGHYDSLARRPRSESGISNAADAQAGRTAPSTSSEPFDWLDADNFAPGANDDGSGTVLTMELARVFAESGIEFDATVVFIALAGEEQGLIGAKAHAQKAAADNLRIDAVLNNDIVGNSRGGNGLVDSESVRVFSEGPEDSPSRQVARFIQRWAGRYYPAHRVRPIARHDRFGRGGDHTAFNQNGYAGVRFSESNENYSRQHTVEDLVDAVDFPYLARNARVNAAAAAVMALAPPAPNVNRGRGESQSTTGSRRETATAPETTASTAATARQTQTSLPRGPMLGRQPGGYNARLRWEPSPGAAAYRIFWRRAWTPDWEHELGVGNVTEFVLPNVSIDDYVFGVAAIGPGGHESLVSAYVNPPREEERVITK